MSGRAGRTGAPDSGAAWLCGNKAHGGSFNNARKQLLELGYVREAASLVEVKRF
ncbi:MAG: hypothetical protein ACLQKK_15315 [Rhodomicrobium sp.]